MTVVEFTPKQGSKKKQQNKTRMLAPEDKLIIRQIPVGQLLRTKKFKSFDSLRQEANRIIAKMRTNWMDFVLMKAGIYVNFAQITKREIIEIYEKHKISIVNVDNVDRIYQGTTLLGEWDRERMVYLDDEGKLMVEIKYFAL